MPIKYLADKQLFHIAAGDVSYVIMIYKQCYPMHVYYGRRIPAEDVSWYVEAPYRRKQMIERQRPDDPMFLREFFPYEYPEYGTSDFRMPAFEVRDAGGSCVTDLRYQGYEIFEGKPELDGLPSTYCERATEASTLRLDLADSQSGLRLALYYTVFRGQRSDNAAC